MSYMIAEKVRNVLVEALGVDEEEVIPAAFLIADLGADSLDTVEIVMALEAAFGLAITDEDCAQWATVQDVIAYLDGRGVKA